MVKVAYNACYGGFGLSEEAILLGRELSGDIKWGNATLYGETYPNSDKINTWLNMSYDPDVKRHDKILIQVIEQLGDKAFGSCAKLKIEEIGDDELYYIDEYDGNESVITQAREKHRWISPNS